MNTTEAIELAALTIMLKMGPGEGAHSLCVVAHTLVCVRPLQVPKDAAVIMKLTSAEMEHGLTSKRWDILDSKLRVLIKGGVL